MREAAYKGLLRPILEYGSSVWDPHYEGLIDDLEKVQKRAARFVTRNYTYEKGSMTDILKKLKWESLQKRRKDNRIILLYKGLKGRARIPTDDLTPKNRRCRNQHRLVQVSYLFYFILIYFNIYYYYFANSNEIFSPLD